MENKVVIDARALHNIKSFSLTRFHDAKGFNDLDGKDMQIALIVGGLEDYLKQKGIEPGFTLDSKIGGK